MSRRVACAHPYIKYGRQSITIFSGKSTREEVRIRQYLIAEQRKKTATNNVSACKVMWDGDFYAFQSPRYTLWRISAHND